MSLVDTEPKIPVFSSGLAAASFAALSAAAASAPLDNTRPAGIEGDSRGVADPAAVGLGVL